MDTAFIDSLARAHQQVAGPLPAAAWCQWADELLALLFPERASAPVTTSGAVTATLSRLQHQVADMLLATGLDAAQAPRIAQATINDLPRLRSLLLQDAEAIVAADPAAQGLTEVIATYPGFYATAVHRLAHGLYQQGVARVPRLLGEFAHARTGIDIHPGAQIGPSFCIDHGTGVVIGETATIGARVRVFQGVTLGALSVAKHLANVKRHPTIEDDVVIYAGATILGGSTVVGRYSIIGGNVWLTESVPSHSRVYHRPQIHVTRAEDPAADIAFSI
ncbi:serine O-acetyltransferase [Hymenobacter sp. BT175]|uniref:serine O-acetyltransferase n=1 Tax=Hymenobacter translucens TaxID=2886507 RepID=UPI001D0E4B2D|nr:serine O-acetyltransferase [Hymenobacter translucens]MCC2547939.1 serine O-acetyltransferase [Hymenobacter translucens]